MQRAPSALHLHHRYRQPAHQPLGAPLEDGVFLFGPAQGEQLVAVRLPFDDDAAVGVESAPYFAALVASSQMNAAA